MRIVECGKPRSYVFREGHILPVLNAVHVKTKCAKVRRHLKLDQNHAKTVERLFSTYSREQGFHCNVYGLARGPRIVNFICRPANILR